MDMRALLRSALSQSPPKERARLMNEPSPNLIEELKGDSIKDFDKAKAFIKTHPQWAEFFESWGQPGSLGDLILLVTFKGDIIVNCHVHQGMH